MKYLFLFPLILFVSSAANYASSAPEVRAIIDWQKHKIFLAAAAPVGAAEIGIGQDALRERLRTAILLRLSRIVAAQWHKVQSTMTGESLSPELADFWAELKLQTFQVAENKASATMEVSLRGKNSLLARLPIDYQGGEARERETPAAAPAYERRAHVAEFDASESEPILYSGLIVDARHLAFRPGLAVNIFTSSGRLIYGASELNRVTAVKRGVAGFFNRETDGEARERTGRRPLKVSAMDIAAGGEGGLIISDEDAAKLLAHSGSAQNLKRARVVILVQSSGLKETH